MPKFLKRMQSFSNVAPSSIAVATLPVTKKYHKVLLRLRHDTSGSGGAAGTLMTQANMLTHIAEIRLRVTSLSFGTQTLWELSGADFIKCINNFYNIDSAAGVLPLIFGCPYWNNPAIEDYFSLGTLDLTNVEIEVKFDSTVVGPELVGFAYEYGGPNEPLGQFLKYQYTNLSNTATGWIEEPDLPVVGNGIGLKALHLSTNAIDEVELRSNGQVVHEDLAEFRPVLLDLNAFRTDGRTEDANYTHLDLAGNNAADVFNMSNVRDFRAKFNRTGTGAFRCITETVIGNAA